MCNSQVNIFKAQLGETVIDSFGNVIDPALDFGCHKEVRSGNSALADSLSDFLFGAIGLSSVNMTDTCLQGSFDCHNETMVSGFRRVLFAPSRARAKRKLCESALH